MNQKAIAAMDYHQLESQKGSVVVISYKKLILVCFVVGMITSLIGATLAVILSELLKKDRILL